MAAITNSKFLHGQFQGILCSLKPNFSRSENYPEDSAAPACSRPLSHKSMGSFGLTQPVCRCLMKSQLYVIAWDHNWLVIWKAWAESINLIVLTIES